MGSLINLFHILFVAPLFYMIGTQQYRDLINPTFLASIGVGVLLYHLYRLFTKGFNLVNLFHVIFVGPFLIHLAYNPTSTSLLLARYLSGFILGFHLVRLMMKML